MGYPTDIEWTDATWNPIGGCSIKSPGCAPCYAQKLAGTRLKNHPLYAGTTDLVKGKPVFNGKMTAAPDRHPVWTWPIRWRGAPPELRKLGPDAPSLIFVGDMSDLFHEDRPIAVIDKVIAAGVACQHTLQLLTKRADVMVRYFETLNARRREFDCHSGLDWMSLPHPRFWLGFSAERQREFDERWPHMRRLAERGWTIFCSYEPAIGPLVLPRDFLALGNRAQVIAGGMSGSKAAPAHPDWFRAVRDQCAPAGVPFFFKQWGEFREITDDDMRSTPAARFEGSPPEFHVVRVGKVRAGRLLDGREWNEFPAVAKAGEAEAA